MHRIILATLLALVLTIGCASAQTKAPLFRFAGANVTSFAASPTDWLVIGGSNSKLVRVTYISVCGIATTASSIDVLLIKRSSADTAGTQSSVTGGGIDVVPPGNPTATVLLYTANPTLGTQIAVMDGKKLNLSVQGAAGCLFWELPMAVLRGQIQQLAINLNGVTVPAGTSLTYTVEVTEE